MAFELKDYEVTISHKYPACGEIPGVEVFSARNANDAIKQARELMRRNGNTRQDGPVIYSAKRINP